MFNSDERYIKKHYGNDNPFTVPKGYFDTLTPRVMKSIAESGVKGNVVQSPKIVPMSAWRRYRKAIVSVAAGVCVAVLSLGAYLNNSNSGKSDKAVAANEHVITPTTEYSSLDEAVDYSMMDTDDMYAYMADLN